MSQSQTDSTSAATLVDCDEGRRMGCATFCCRLIVRLAPGERDPSRPEDSRKRCVDKHPDTGLCMCFDADTGRCTAWQQRPKICREYDCNTDPLLQLVLAEGFTSLTRLLTAKRPYSTQSERFVPLRRSRRESQGSEE